MKIHDKLCSFMKKDNNWKIGYVGFLGLLAFPTQNYGLLALFAFFGLLSFKKK